MGKAPKAARKAVKAKAPKKASKAKKVVKRRAARKPKRVTKKMQTGSKRQVWNGSKLFTKGVLTKDSLKLNKRGKVVYKNKKVPAKAFAAVKKWNGALMKARKELGITGFMTINRGEMGIKLYKLAKSYVN